MLKHYLYKKKIYWEWEQPDKSREGDKMAGFNEIEKKSVFPIKFYSTNTCERAHSFCKCSIVFRSDWNCSYYQTFWKVKKIVQSFFEEWVFSKSESCQSNKTDWYLTNFH